MISLGELDLADTDDEGPQGPGPWRVLVRWGRHPLGELHFDHLAEVRCEGGLRIHAANCFPWAIRGVRTRPTPDGIDPADITVVVCTRHRAELLDGCLDSLQRLDPAPGAVLVVDNGPDDAATQAISTRHEVGYVAEPQTGLDRARNRGWRTAVTPVVVFVDDDARVDPGLIAAYAEAFDEPTIGAATGLVLPALLDSRARVEFERLGGMGKGFVRRYFQAHQVGLQAHQLGVGTNMGFLRSALDAIGGFDPALDVGTPSRGGGDLDALRRTIEAGWEVLYEPSAIVRHLHRAKIDELIDQHRDYGTAYAAVLERVRQRDPGRATEVRRELRRWHLHRHVRGPLGAVRRRNYLFARLLLAEAAGSRSGRKSVTGVGWTDVSG